MQGRVECNRSEAGLAGQLLNEGQGQGQGQEEKG